MTIPLEITCRNFPSTPTIEQHVRKHIQRLARYCDDIVSYRVLVETPHRHQRKGRLYHVRITLRLPGGELVVNRDPPERRAHEEVHVAIRDAFNACRRELQDYVRVRRGDVKVATQAS